MSSNARKASDNRGRGVGEGKKHVAAKAAAAVEADANEAYEIGDNTCVVCFKVVEIFSIGECDHPVCYECSTRMRVLCKQNECPICRTDLSKVMFTSEILTFRQLEINNRTGLYDKKHRICFSTTKIQEAFNLLLENPCVICDQGPFSSFATLRDHVKKKHEQFYCDICTENLSVFSFERKSYNRTDLGIHRRKGDPDNKSHRGHPLCEYCDLRFFDRDELFKHLRREHFYCHFCDADGANCYYADYDALRVHFGKDHYLCEDGDCAQEQFTAVFRSEIDLKAHIANIHGQGLGRQAAKQIRTLELEITLAPRNRQGGENSRSGGGGSSSYRSRHHPPDTQNEFDSGGDHVEPMTVFQAPQRVIDAQNEQEFPSLGGTSGASASFSMRPNVSIRHSYGPGGFARTKENFPALGGNASSTAAIPNASGSGSYKQGSASALLKPANKATPKQGVVIHVSNRPNSTVKKPVVGPSGSNDFPSLSGSGVGKKASVSFLETDFVAPTAASAYSNNIASKHRQLVDGYEPHTSEASSAKIALVQQRPDAVIKKSVVDAAPKINSKHNFPALGNSPGAALAPQWVTLTKKAPVESRKTKVAPPPLSKTNSYPALDKPSKAPPATVTANKKDAKAKPAVAKQPEKQYTATVHSNDTKAKNSKKINVQRYQSHNNDDDVIEPEFVPSATVLNAVSAKHRSMVDSYESIAKPGLGSGSKLSMVQRDTTSSAKTKTNTANVPKLNSNMFPSLSSNGTTEFNNNPNAINFIEIMKNSTAVVAGNGNIVSKVDRTKTSPRHSSNNNGEVKSTAPGPPPGFDGSTSTAPVPPPGFNSVTLNSVAKPTNNLTFTTSLGESFKILPTHNYLAPPNCAKRNQALFTLFQTTILNPEVVESFKLVSQLYINDSYNALPYYEHCQIALGDKFDAIFPELLALLPDIGKQQELYLVHSQQQTSNDTTTKASKKRNQTAALEVCATCKQVLIASDLVTHLQSHALENNFPTLNNHPTQSSAWKN